MNTFLAVGLFGVLSSLGALIACAWAARRGQFAASEDAKYAMLADDDDALSPPTVMPRRARWFLAALAAVFAWITVSFLVTIVTATRADSSVSPAASASFPAPPAPSSPSPVLKCPF